MEKKKILIVDTDGELRCLIGYSSAAEYERDFVNAFKFNRPLKGENRPYYAGLD